MRDYSAMLTAAPPPSRGGKTTTTAPPTSSASTTSSTVSPGDALAVRREGAESVIAKLRAQLNENESAKSTNATAIARQEAVILELRSEVRQFQRENNELRDQLNRTNAQADTVRKELEDTLEAEQYTWELRVQELERELQQQQPQNLGEVGKLQRERAELQACLDEALKELEAVDAELQNNNDLECVSSLYSWLLRNEEGENLPDYQTVPEWVHAIQSLLGQKLKENDRLRHVETQMTNVQGDLDAQNESTAELRASLREAVDLLKPLQDAVAKGDREKSRLESQLQRSQKDAATFQQQVRDLKSRLHESEDESDRLWQSVESLEVELSKMKLEVASSVVSHHSASIDDGSVQKTREELRSKRKSEKTLKHLLRDAQVKFSVLQKQNEQVAARNSELQRKVNDSVDSGTDATNATIKSYQAQVEHLEAEIQQLRSKHDTEELHAELDRKNRALNARRQSETTLHNSLKEALGLIKPLQVHLEESEQEKAALMEELIDLKNGSGLRDTVRQLELENSQLQDVLEEMSQTVSSDRLAQELVELQSRYEVTQRRLDSALKKGEGRNGDGRHLVGR